MRLRFRADYPAHRDSLHDEVRAAAGNRCVRCGHPQGDRMRRGVKELMPCGDECSHANDGKLRILTVHHLDGDKSNSAWWNLLALCQVCHLVIQGKVIPERPYLWQHTTWFRPYVCGFYAKQAGIDITREQAEAEPDRWLKLGQPWLYEEQAS